MDIQRVAVIFDNLGRPETTGVYCRRALGQLVEVEHFLPSELSQIPRGRFDLFINIDDGLDYRLPEDLRPAALWAIDTHLDFERTRRRAPAFDFLFTAQRDGAAQLDREGFGPISWLPLACDPEIHKMHAIAKSFDVCFIGNRLPGIRSELLSLIEREFPNHLIDRRFFDEMAEAYSASRIVFNRSIRNDINMRVFEALACGAFLLTNELDANGQADLFQNGKHLVTYQSAEEFLDQARYYLHHENQREQIAAAGRQLVLDRHTYRHRMQTILDCVRQHSKSQSRDPGAKSSGYFEFGRPEVLALIPTDAARILDIGCGAGRLGFSVKRRQTVEVVGIELNPTAAEAARGRLDSVLSVNIESDDFDFPEGRFDCVVCADVLEHLRRPDAVLRKIARWLTPNGCLVASIPNVRNHSVVHGLLQGHWSYEPAGLLDDDHARFFTRREIEKLLFRAGFDRPEIQGVPGPGYREWRDAGALARVEVSGLRFETASAEEAEEFYIYQYLTKCRPARRQQDGLTSIIVLTHNQLDYTRLCLDSLRFRTDEPYELIVVDNASTDGTVEYLRHSPDVHLIANRENRGFPAGVNQGLEVARGENILLLNNDTVLTTGWLRHLLDALHSAPDIGLCGPCTNNISGEQRVPVDYTDFACLDGFAWDWNAVHRGQRIVTDRLVGFCLLIRRKVIEQIGNFDERFGIGNFEDDDFCRRARAVGYQAVIAQDAFIHHFGSRTFSQGFDLAALLDENRRKYDEKWQAAPESLPAQIPGKSESQRRQPAVSWRAARLPSGGLALSRQVIKLSLCMIVRDNESTIGPCLESIRPWVDEMIVVDTGSKDRTPEICRQYGARVYEFPWCDDFSAARNESLKYACGDWIFWMDSDDTIPAECGQKLRTLVDGPHASNTLGYVMQVHCPGGSDPGAPDVTIVDHVKLIQNRSDVRFEGRIHEQLLPSIRRAGGDVAWTDCYVVHSGSERSVAGWLRKLERDLRILHLEITEKPDHPFVLFNLGMTYADAKRFKEACEYLDRCLAVSNPEESHVRKAYALLVSSLNQAERYLESERICRRGLEQYPDDKELLFRSAMLHHHFGRLAQSEHDYLRVLNETAERHFTSVDAALAGYKARHNLALVYGDMGKHDLAEVQWRAILHEVENYAAAWRGLADSLIRRHKFRDVEVVVDNLLARKGALRSEGVLLRGWLAAARGDFESAIRDLEEVHQANSDDLEPLRSLCQMLFERGSLDHAELKLAELVRRAPDDPAALHNLATVRFRQRKYTEAIEAFEKSLQLRPDSLGTWLQYGWAFKHAGRVERAVDVWQKLLERFPDCAEASAALEASGVKREVVNT